LGWWKRTYQYGPASRLTQALDYPMSGQPPTWLQRWAWTYNTAGERTGQTVQYDAPPSGSPPQDPPVVTQIDESYTWDAYGVLDKTFPAGNEAATRDNFTFDAAGNVQTLAQVDGTILSLSYDPSGRTKTVTIGGTGQHSDGTVVTSPSHDGFQPWSGLSLETAGDALAHAAAEQSITAEQESRTVELLLDYYSHYTSAE
jgi:YD repeat-containing protein